VQALISWLTSFGSFLLVLGVLVFVHELGHYLMARRLRIGVLTFSLGFGPRIAGFVRGGTDYCIRAIPLGGYVKLRGENPEEQLSGSREEFLSRGKWDRFLVYVMGPVMNVVLAIVLMWVVLLRGAQVPAFENQVPIVGSVVSASPAERAGIQAKDRIVRIAGRRVDTWEQVFTSIGSRPNRDVQVVVWREGRELTLTVRPDAKTRYEVGDIGVLPDTHPIVRSVVTGEPADKAGVKPGDMVTAIDGQRITFWAQLVAEVSKRPEQSIVLSVVRDGEPLRLAVTTVRQGSVGRIGVVGSDQTTLIEPGPIGAFWMSLERNYEFSGLIFRTLAGLFTRETSPRQLLGPVGIAQLSGESASLGIMALLMLMASLSLNLGIINLLPIPVLDGGHIFLMAIEGIARRDFSARVKEKILLAGFVVLLTLMVTVIYNDLTRVAWIERFMFWR
jgi:regulator of sigma E protease